MSAEAFSAFDRSAMARALQLAARGLETAHPNPRVGCVIARDGQVIGEGWHARTGEPHAEVHALRAAGPAASGATAYVTLEPCSHVGRTPPCALALLEAGVERVVFALADPNPRVNGGGARLLRERGVRVESGLLEQEAAELNAGFLKRMRTGRPWVRVKLAMSLDGRTALGNGESHWITGPAAREDVQRWRARSGAVLTGVGTVLARDPRLDVRLPDPPPGPRPPQVRVGLDPRGRTPPQARLLSPPGGAGVVRVLAAADAAGEGAVDSLFGPRFLLERPLPAAVRRGGGARPGHGERREPGGDGPSPGSPGASCAAASSESGRRTCPAPSSARSSTPEPRK